MSTVPPCLQGIPPEDAAAWALDAEPRPDIDLAAHVPGCPACSAAVAAVAPAAHAAAALRTARPAAPVSVSERAAGRIGIEATTGVVLRTVLGAFGRVAKAVPDYLLAHDEGARR